MKNRKTGIGIILAVGTAGLVWAQGSLTPPGAPGATMKTLTQVEPRTPISSAPFTISQSGSYYLTTNLTSTRHGVVIAASDVTLDLMGFALNGDRGSSDYGVFLDGATSNAIRNVVVRNGIVRGFGDGVWAGYAQNSRFERLIAATNLLSGINLYGPDGQCDGNTIADCTVSGNGNYGIYLNGSYSGHCNGNTIADCTVSGNGSYGIYLNGGYNGQCNVNTLTDCTISGNGNYGIYLYGEVGRCDGNTIADCTVSGNASYGIYLYGADGQCDGNTITGCTIRKNTNRGIYILYGDGNRVEGNHITGQTGSPSYGILCDFTTKNLIFRNTCVEQTNNISFFNSSDTFGPIVTNTGALTTTNGAAGLSPWANFSR